MRNSRDYVMASAEQRTKEREMQRDGLRKKEHEANSITSRLRNMIISLCSSWQCYQFLSGELRGCQVSVSGGQASLQRPGARTAISFHFSSRRLACPSGGQHLAWLGIIFAKHRLGLVLFHICILVSILCARSWVGGIRVWFYVEENGKWDF